MKRTILLFLLFFGILAALLPGSALAEGEEGAAFTVGSLTVLDENGDARADIPDGSFQVIVPVARQSEQEDALVLLAAFTDGGQFRGLLSDSLGDRDAVTFQVANPDGDIASLKAFAVPSFKDLTPLGPAGEFSNPADEVNFPAALFAAVESREPNKSLSSVSVQYALGLLRAGAEGTTKDQLDRLLTGVDFTKWNETLATVENGPTVEVANSIWFDTSVTPSETYLKTVREDFGAESRTLVLTTQAAVDTINAWVCEKTHELIKTILDEPLDDDAAAVLINALYFKGEWTVPFEKDSTRDQTFHNRSGADKTVPFMHDTRHGMTCIDTETCRGVALPYKGDGSWYMLALLPKGDRTADSLAGEDFGALLDGARKEFVRLALPKFTVEGSYDLTGPLQSLGMTEAFAGGFDPMGFCAKGPIVVSRVLHKTYLRVDEEGTEAAAVTAVVTKANSMPGQEPIEMTFDRPFLCCLWNSEIGQPLFLTAVNELK